jgi:DNA-binding PadR family transcriptional regulator
VASRSPFQQQPAALETSLLRILLVGPASGYVVTQRLGMGQHDPDPYVARLTYVALHRLERKRLLASEWRPVPGRTLAAKYYRLTAAGVRRLHGSNVAPRPTSTVDPLTALVILAVIGAANTARAAEASRQPRLTVLVRCHVPIPIDELRRASMDVTRILGAIGVKADWVLEEPSASRPSGRGLAAGFVVHVVIDARPLISFPSSDEVFLGMTSPDQREGSAEILIFEDRIQQVAEVYQKAVSSVLALVVVHEIGHVLLPSPAHSDAGIMQAPWDPHALDKADENSLLFTARQGELIRQRLSHCCEITARPQLR